MKTETANTEQVDCTEVRQFWEQNPLSALESDFPPGSREFFRWHDSVRKADVEPFAMHLYEFDRHAGQNVLDVGCGIGWLCRHFRGAGADVVGVDLTRRGVELTRERLRLDGLACTLVQASAEQLPFESGSFDFVTCAGVLHHTPDTQRGVREIHRVMRPGGRGMISLYYRNFLLSDRLWPVMAFLIRTFMARVPGRGALHQAHTVHDFVRIYDGDRNPLGKCYTRREVKALLQDFQIERLETHYFPRRFLPLGRWWPRWVHRLFDRQLGLMIYATVRKLAP